jgi:hypothetical protein
MSLFFNKHQAIRDMAANAKVTSNPGTRFSSPGVGDTAGEGVSVGVSVGVGVAVEVANFFPFHAFIPPSML